MSELIAPKRYDVRRYDLGCFDKHFCLKPPFILQLIIVLMCRDFLLPIILAAASLKGAAGNMESAVMAVRQPYWFAIQLPSLLVVYAWIRRVPTAAAAARWIWRRGAALLSISILLSACQPLQEMFLGSRMLGSGEFLEMLLLLLEMTALAYIWLSRRVRDAFRDFPEAVTS